MGIFGRILLLFSSGGPHWVKSYGLKPGKTKGHVVVLAFPNGQEVTLSYDPKTIKTSIGSGREALPMLAFLRGSFMCSGMATLQSVACRHRQQLLGFVERDSGHTGAHVPSALEGWNQRPSAIQERVQPCLMTWLFLGGNLVEAMQTRCSRRLSMARTSLVAVCANRLWQ